MKWILLGSALGMMMAAKARGETRQVTFEITTKTPLPVGEQVFVTGNHDSLGNWAAVGAFASETVGGTSARNPSIPRPALNRSSPSRCTVARIGPKAMVSVSLLAAGFIGALEQAANKRASATLEVGR